MCSTTAVLKCCGESATAALLFAVLARRPIGPPHPALRLARRARALILACNVRWFVWQNEEQQMNIIRECFQVRGR